MKRSHYIAFDTHNHSTEMVCRTPSGRITVRDSCRTTIPSLVELIERIRRPRVLTFEESPLADWLYRSLSPFADRIIVCNPRRNALIAKESDKDDPIDAEKLSDLLRGGYLKPVHHPESLERAVFKQIVGVYYQTVRHRVREANRIIGYLKRWGIFVREAAFSKRPLRQELLRPLPPEAPIRTIVSSLFSIYDKAVEQEAVMEAQLRKQARKEDIIRKWKKLPGIGWIRAATFFVYLDTPWRFRKKTQLWRYMGIGLERRKSGSSAAKVRVSQQANRQLKGAILGAAMSAINARENPFADQYRRWIKQSISPHNARRNVARSMASVLWGMWKNGNDYRPEWVGLLAREISS